MPDESHYRGFRLNELYVIEVSWSEWSMHHLQTRTERHPDDPDEINIAPEWATEASLDPDGRLSLTRENDLRVTGWSPHAPAASWSQRTGRVLRVVLKPLEISEGDGADSPPHQPARRLRSGIGVNALASCRPNNDSSHV